MKITNNTLSKKMLDLLKTKIQNKLIEIDYNNLFNNKELVNENGIKLNFADDCLLLFSDIKYFKVLDGEDYSYLALYDNNDSEFSLNIKTEYKNKIKLNQKITDIQIVTDTYCFTNTTAEIDEMYICDCAIIFILEDRQICIEKYDIFENLLSISNSCLGKELTLFDNSEDFDYPEYYETKRSRTIKSLEG